MKKFKKLTVATLALSFSFLGLNSLANPLLSSADSQTQKEDYLDLGVNKGKEDYQEKRVIVNPNKLRYEQFLSEVRDIRAKSWESNVPYTLEADNKKGTTIRDIAKEYGYETRDEYVNAIEWSDDLEKIAIQRSFEQTYTGLGSKRPDGAGIKSATINGNYSNKEILTADTVDPNYTDPAGKWSYSKLVNANNMSQYEILLKENGVMTDWNSKFHDLLNPSYKYVGFAEVRDINKGPTYATAELASEISNNNSELTNISGEYTLSIGQTKDEALSHKMRAEIEFSINQAQLEMKAAEELIENYPETIKNVKDKLVKLINENNEIIKELQALLK